MRQACFFDRDGVIIEEADYIHDPALVRLCPFAAEAVRAMHDAGLVGDDDHEASGVVHGADGLRGERAQADLGGIVDVVGFFDDDAVAVEKTCLTHGEIS